MYVLKYLFVRKNRVILTYNDAQNNNLLHESLRLDSKTFGKTGVKIIYSFINKLTN